MSTRKRVQPGVSRRHTPLPQNRWEFLAWACERRDRMWNVLLFVAVLSVLAATGLLATAIMHLP